jgi:hypothetical protein
MDELVNLAKPMEKRCVASTWQLTAPDLTHDQHVDAVTALLLNEAATGSTCKEFRANVRRKLYGYRQQDAKKGRPDAAQCAVERDVYVALAACGFECFYCHAHVLVLYEYRRDGRQWTLDRVNNAASHTAENVVVSCLRCNLSRRTTNDSLFYNTKNLEIRMVD